MKDLDRDYMETSCGIKVITSEACRIGMRLSCDLTEQGKKLVADYFDLESVVLQPSHNADYPAGSIMLSRADVLALKIFNALANDGVRLVIERKRDCPVAIEEADTFDQHLALCKCLRFDDNVEAIHVLPARITESGRA